MPSFVDRYDEEAKRCAHLHHLPAHVRSAKTVSRMVTYHHGTVSLLFESVREQSITKFRVGTVAYSDIER
jgi:hypothetical protein